MTAPKLKFTFLGTGSAFTVGEDNFHSNILIEDIATKSKLLFDCGSDARLSAHELGYSFKDIDSVYISHIHADHTGGLEWLGFSRYFSECDVSDLYVSQDIVGPLWDSLAPGMSSLEDSKATLDTFFNVHPINLKRRFVWKAYVFHLEYAKHVINNGIELPCYGLTLEINDKIVYVSSDTLNIYNENPELYKKADVIFHDCETLPFKSGVHANYTDLVKLPEEVKNKMWLYHYNPGPRPKPIKDGFKGFVQKGQVFEF
tara:strand:- start:81 stop:854 length:774 start_codon:yes stop_codon:yes gene_type:complete